MDALTDIFRECVHHYKIIGDGLKLHIADVISMQGTQQDKLREIFQRWFDARKDVNWDTLIRLCDKKPELGHAKYNIQAYLGK